MDVFVAEFEVAKGAISIFYELSALLKTVKLPMDKKPPAAKKEK